jgi:hypothetical protein
MRKYQNYNGWANRETWLVNLWFGDYFEGMSMERKITEEFIKAEVEGYIKHCNLIGFVSDLIDLSVINYAELAQHYKQVVE